MYTQCPECQTIFEIDEDALQASLGVVQCGHCNSRFDALRTLSEKLPREPDAGLPERQAEARAPTLTRAVPPEQLQAAAKKRLSGKDRGPPGEGDVDWFAQLPDDVTAALIADAAGIPPGATGDAGTWHVPDTTDAGNADPSAYDDTPPVDDADVAPTAPADTAEGVDELPLPVEGAWPDADGGDLDESDGGASGDATPLAEADPDAEATPDAEHDDAKVDAVPVYVPPVRRVARTSAAWWAGCAVLALLLLAQLAWAARVDLYRSPSTHAWVERACSAIPCRLPLIRDTAQLELLSRDVRPDPAAAGALAITATVRNDAGFRQPWPVVVVALTDLDGNAVAMRRFRPAEYMPDPARRAAGIAPGATAAVAFEVRDPGKRAVAFRFGLE